MHQESAGRFVNEGRKKYNLKKVFPFFSSSILMSLHSFQFKKKITYLVIMSCVSDMFLTNRSWTHSAYLIFFRSFLMIITERKVRQTFGPVAQLSKDRLINVPKQLPSFVPREVDGPQVYCRSTHFNHVLPHEGK